MIIKTVPVGMLLTNCYILMDEDTKEAIVIDPGSKPEKILAEIKELQASVKYIIFTHAHYDHIVAAHYVQEPTGAKILMHKGDCGWITKEAVSKFGRYTTKGYVEVSADRYLEDGDTITLGNLTINVMNTPGHSNGGICLICKDVIFSGDTLFKGTCGRCDLVDGDYNKMLDSLKRIAELPGDYRVLPGHEAATTLEVERKTNQFIVEAMAR